MLGDVKVLPPVGWPTGAVSVSAPDTAPAGARFSFGAAPVSVEAKTRTVLSAFDDSYERHVPEAPAAAARANRLLDRLAPIRTHERVLFEVDGSVFGLEVGVTMSQFDLVRKNTHGLEFIQVAAPDGSSNIETVLGRLFLSHNHRIELQGPALNTTFTPGALPLGARFVGIGLTSDITSAMAHDAVSYSVEVKLTDRSVAELAALGGPGAAALAASALEGAGSGAAAVVADAVLGAVPVVSAGLAVASAHRAWHVLHDETAAPALKAFAVAHCAGDTVRVVAPLVGTMMNAGLVGVAAVCGWIHMRHAAHADPVGPGVDPPGADPLVADPLVADPPGADSPGDDAIVVAEHAP